MGEEQEEQEEEQEQGQKQEEGEGEREGEGEGEQGVERAMQTRERATETKGDELTDGAKRENQPGRKKEKKGM